MIDDPNNDFLDFDAMLDDMIESGCLDDEDFEDTIDEQLIDWEGDDFEDDDEIDEGPTDNDALGAGGWL